MSFTYSDLLSYTGPLQFFLRENIPQVAPYFNNDYLQIEYDLGWERPEKISKNRSSMFRDNLDITETLKEIEIPDTLQLSEIENKLALKDLFELDKKYP